MAINPRQMMHAVLITSCLVLAPPALAGVANPATAPAAEISTLFAINYRAGPNWKPGVPLAKQGLRDHFYYWKSLTEQGKVASAGQLGPDGGLVLLRVRSQSEADEVLRADPAVTAGIFVGEARRYFPRFVGKAIVRDDP